VFLVLKPSKWPFSPQTNNKKERIPRSKNDNTRHNGKACKIFNDRNDFQVNGLGKKMHTACVELSLLWRRPKIKSSGLKSEREAKRRVSKYLSTPLKRLNGA
jgi:hypothetical protein